LAQNNPYLHPFTNILSRNKYLNQNNPFPRVTHILTDINPPPINPHDIMVPNYNFPNEVHNEDFHYSRLIVGFIQKSNTLRISIFTYDPNLKPLLFLNFFTDGRGHFHDISTQSTSTNKTHDETYGKYIKLRLMNYDPR